MASSSDNIDAGFNEMTQPTITPTQVSTEAKLAMVEAILEAVTSAMRGEPVSDFMESFWVVREAGDLRRELDILRALHPAKG